MMPVVRVNDAAFADLKVLATWLGTETPSQTIDAIVRQTMEKLGLERDDKLEAEVAASSGDVLQFSKAPGLSFTKPISATVNGNKFDNPRWSGVLFSMISQLKAKGLMGEKLARELEIPARVGEYVDEGFKHYRELGVSIQGQSASAAWKEIDRIAKKWRIPVTVEFQWRQNDKAQHPGRVGVLRSGKA